jgi:hypothetical protein
VIFRPHDDRCASTEIGRAGGPQLVYVADGCSYGNVLHEIGHVVGLWHEHTRTDRGSWIEIHEDNILPNKEQNFETYDDRGEDGQNLWSLDFGSVMMYSSNAFSDGTGPTITKLDGSTFTSQRNILSDSDIGGATRFLTRSSSTALYNIRNSRSNLCLDLEVDSRNRETRLSQKSCDGTTSQRWYLYTPAGSSDRLIINEWTGMCLSTSATAPDPDRAMQLPCSAGGNQIVALDYSATNGYLFSMPWWGECLEVAGGSLSSGAAVQKDYCSGGADQRWRFYTAN